MICIANETDLPQIAAIEKDLFNQPWTLSNFREAYENPVATIWVVKPENKDTIAGYLCMYSSVDEGEIVTVAVAPDFRRNGFGDQLIEAAKEYALEKHLGQIVLEVRISNAPAIALYEKNNFVNLGIRKGFYDFPKEDAMIMAWENLEC